MIKKQLTKEESLALKEKKIETMHQLNSDFVNAERRIKQHFKEYLRIIGPNANAKS